MMNNWITEKLQQRGNCLPTLTQTSAFESTLLELKLTVGRKHYMISAVTCLLLDYHQLLLPVWSHWLKIPGPTVHSLAKVCFVQDLSFNFSAQDWWRSSFSFVLPWKSQNCKSWWKFIQGMICQMTAWCWTCWSRVGTIQLLHFSALVISFSKTSLHMQKVVEFVLWSMTTMWSLWGLCGMWEPLDVLRATSCPGWSKHKLPSKPDYRLA